ncbi:MAG: hypothetical protein ACR2PL_13155 [Dehalococcoidia bacterium]
MRCREGHESTESDYCSVCGVAMDAGGLLAVATADPAAVAAAAAGACPACGEPRADPAARFCEVCRFDFVAGVQGPPPTATAPLAVADPAPLPAAAPVPSPAMAPSAIAAISPNLQAAAAQPSDGQETEKRWEAVVGVDPSLEIDPDPALPCPLNEPERIFHLDLEETLIGRRDERRDIRPEIPVHDPGASRRHAKLLRPPDGTVALLDLASSSCPSVSFPERPSGEERLLEGGG